MKNVIIINKNKKKEGNKINKNDATSNFNDINNILNVEVKINKRFYTDEKTLIKFICEKKEKNIVIFLDEIPNGDFEIFERLAKKKVSFNLINIFEETISGSFTIISSYIKKGNEVYITLSNDFFQSFTGINFLSNIFIYDTFLFNERYSTEIFFEILKNYKKNELVLSLDELKTKLKIPLDKYSRYYDFEKNVILKSLRDINKNSHLSVSFEKIKKSTHKNSKVEYIIFKFYNSALEAKIKFVNDLTLIAKNHILNFKEFQEVCYEAVKTNDEEYILNILDYTINEHKKGDFTELFRKNLSKSELNMYFYINKKYTNLYFIYLDIVKELKKIAEKEKFELGLINETIGRKILKLKDNEFLKFHVNNITIEINYFKDKETVIKIFCL